MWESRTTEWPHNGVGVAVKKGMVGDLARL